jgi:hypothetical protein
MPLMPQKFKLPMSGDEEMTNLEEPQTPEEGGEKTPPNFRDASAEAPICGTCAHFAGASCKKYGNYPCKFHEGCDDHSDLAPEGEQMEPEEPTPAPPEATEKR